MQREWDYSSYFTLWKPSLHREKKETDPHTKFLLSQQYGTKFILYSCAHFQFLSLVVVAFKFSLIPSTMTRVGNNRVKNLDTFITIPGA